LRRNNAPEIVTAPEQNILLYIYKSHNVLLHALFYLVIFYIQSHLRISFIFYFLFCSSRLIDRYR